MPYLMRIGYDSFPQSVVKPVTAMAFYTPVY